MWKQTAEEITLCLSIFCFVACAAALPLSGMIVSLFSDNPAVMVVRLLVLIMQVLAIPLTSGSGLMMSTLQAYGKGLASNALSLAKGAALILGVIVGSMLFGIDGVIGSLLFSEALAFLVAGILCWLSFKQRNDGQDEKSALPAPSRMSAIRFLRTPGHRAF